MWDTALWFGVCLFFIWLTSRFLSDSTDHAMTEMPFGRNGTPKTKEPRAISTMCIVMACICGLAAIGSGGMCFYVTVIGK